MVAPITSTNQYIPSSKPLTPENGFVTPASVAALSKTAQNPMDEVNAASVAPPLNATANANANTTIDPNANPLAALGANPMAGAAPNIGVLNPPDKTQLPPNPDAYQQNGLPSLPPVPKKGNLGIQLALVGQVAVAVIGGIFLAKGIKNVGSKLWKLLNR